MGNCIELSIAMFDYQRIDLHFPTFSHDFPNFPMIFPLKPPFLGISRKCLTGRQLPPWPTIRTDPYTGVPIVQIYRPCCNFYRIYSCIHVYIYMYVCKYVYMYMCVWIYMIYIYTWYIHMYTYMWISIYIYIHNVIIAPVIPFLGNRGSLIHSIVTLPLMKQRMFLSGIMDAQSMYNIVYIWYMINIYIYIYYYEYINKYQYITIIIAIIVVNPMP